MAIAGTAIAATAANSKTENSTISTKNQVVETRQQDSGNTENEENLLYGKIKKITKDTVELESVIMYSLGNEIPEIGIRRGQEICRMLHEKVKQLDSTRYTTVAVNGVFSVGDVIPEIVEDVLGQECVKNLKV